MNEKAETSPRAVWIWIFALSALAFALRYTFIQLAWVNQPIRGDASEYCAYAWNIVHHGVFSKAFPNATEVVPDSFRDPGYPLFLAAILQITPDMGEWYDRVLTLQCAFGALTVLGYLAAARRWLSLRWLISAGVLMAIWPHSITIAGYIVSEPLFALLLSIAFACLAEAVARKSIRWTASSGIAFAAAALTNAVVLPFAPLLALLFLFAFPVFRTQWIAFLLIVTIVPGLWLVRNAGLDTHASSSQRAAMNFVQGSWPEYHSAWRTRLLDPEHSDDTMERIDAEVAAMDANGRTGYTAVVKRLMSDPARYASWYLSKPILLWSWSIQMGEGDIYVYPTINSPFQTLAAARAMIALLYVLNPVIALFALGGIIACLIKGRRPEVVAMAALLIFITCVYSILQAEPRYAIAFRGPEIIMAISGAAILTNYILARRGLPQGAARHS